CNDEACTGGEFNIADIDLESGWTSQLGSIVREGVLGLCHTDRQFVLAQFLDLSDGLVCLGGVNNAVCTVNGLGEGFDLLLDRQVDVVDRSKVCRFFAGFDNLLSQFDTAFASFCKDVGQCKFYIVFAAVVFQNFDLVVRLGQEVIDGNHDRNTEFLHVFNVSSQVAQTG